MKPRAESDHPISDRKTSDRALILLLVGCVLLLPPVANIFLLDLRIMGIPFTGIYLFAVWGGLIVGGAILSRRLQSNADRLDAQSKPPAEQKDSSA